MSDSVALAIIARETHRNVFSQLALSAGLTLTHSTEKSFEISQTAYRRLSFATDAAAVPGLRASIIKASGDLAAYAVMPAAAIAPRLVVFDTDSTFIDQEVIDEIADFAGMKPEVAKITDLAMQGKLDFNAALKERVALLRDLPEDTLARVLNTRLTVTRGGEELVRELAGAGAQTYLLSGGFSFFTSALRSKYGLTGDFANELEIEAGRLTGRTKGPIVNRVRKAELLRQIARDAEIPLRDTIAIGDGANDIDMVQASGLGIAFCARPALVQAANAAIFERDLRLVARLIDPS